MHTHTRERAQAIDERVICGVWRRANDDDDDEEERGTLESEREINFCFFSRSSIFARRVDIYTAQ
jgi:hypothetical protein